MMYIETAEEAIETYTSFDDWRYADREAAWKWMFEQGWNAALEKAALVAESTICDTHIPTGVDIYGSRAAKNIRALKEE